MSAYLDDLAFIHIPKCAGTSVRKTLGMKSFDAIDEKHRSERDPALANHFPVYRIQKLLQETNSDIPFDRLFKFMVVRNPWARMVSLYRHRQKKLHLSYQGKPRNTEEDKEAVNRGFTYWLTQTPHEGDKVLTRMPQMDWGRNENGDFALDYILQLENLEKHWSRMNTCIKRNLPPLMQINVGEPVDYRQEYTQEAYDHVEHWFAEDIERFGYAF